MCGRCVRKCFTAWNTSTRPSLFTLSMAALRAQNEPVRPIPALEGGGRREGGRKEGRKEKERRGSKE